MPCVYVIAIAVFIIFNAVDGEIKIPSTLDGPFKPVTVPLDDSLRGKAVDLPDSDPRVERSVKGFEPEQISVSLSAEYHSVWISWITGICLSLSLSLFLNLVYVLFWVIYIYIYGFYLQGNSKLVTI
jgi:hypothetical protein